MGNDPKTTIHLVVRNNLPTQSKVVLEPWGDEHTLDPEATISLVATGPVPGKLEIEIASGRLLIYGWTGSVIQVIRNADGERC